MRWASYVGTARIAANRYGPVRVLEVQYENLILRPQEQLARICDAIGVAPEERMLDPRGRSSDVALSSEHRYAHPRVAEPLDPTRLTSYEQLPDPFIWLVERYAGKAMVEYGYELKRPQLGAVNYVRVMARLLRYRERLRANLIWHLKASRPTLEGVVFGGKQ